MDRRLQRLKNDARREEQRENWVRAIALYREALRRSEELGSVSLDVSLYDRVGDLHRRLGDAERTGVYRRLGRLHAEAGLVAEARKSFEAFAERMRAEGRHTERRDALLELAERIGDRDLLLRVTGEMVEAGEGDAALDALLRALQESPGDEAVREKIRRIEPSAPAPAAASGRAARGRCFVEKELPSVAVRVLNRALDCFQRVHAVDIDFRDVSERMREVLLRL